MAKTTGSKPEDMPQGGTADAAAPAADQGAGAAPEGQAADVQELIAASQTLASENLRLATKVQELEDLLESIDRERAAAVAEIHRMQAKDAEATELRAPRALVAVRPKAGTGGIGPGKRQQDGSYFCTVEEAAALVGSHGFEYRDPD